MQKDAPYPEPVELLMHLVHWVDCQLSPKSVVGPTGMGRRCLHAGIVTIADPKNMLVG